jgi:hypothetical protein
MNDMMSKHYDLDQRVYAVMAGLDLDIKQKLIARLPQIVAEMEAEMKSLNGEDIANIG